MDYVVVKSEVKFKGKVLTLRVDEVRMPSGRVADREVISHFGAVGMVPLLDTGEVILVKQYRHPVKGYLLEIPAGKLAKNEDPLECARRELKEEIGMEAGELIKLTQFYTTPGYSNEYFHLYLAKNLKPCLPTGRESRMGQVEEEIVGTERMPLDKALELIDEGKIEDGKTIAGLCLTKLHLT